MAISVAVARMDTLEFPGASGHAWLSASERSRREGFGSTARRHSFDAGRWLARCVLAERLGHADPASLLLDIDAQGRSSVPSSPSLGVSISHSGDWVACAVADAPVGIDIERLRPRNDLLALAAMTNSPADCAELAALPDEARLLRFYQWWTLKEAGLKRQGLGLDFARMKALSCVEAATETAQALTLFDRESGVVLALDGSLLDVIVCPPGFGQLQGWR